MTLEIPFPQPHNPEEPEKRTETPFSDVPPPSELSIEVHDHLQVVKEELGLSLTRRENAERIADRVNEVFQQRYGIEQVVQVRASGADSQGRHRYQVVSVPPRQEHTASIKERLRDLTDSDT